MPHKTMRRDKLRRLVEAGRVVMVEGYSFDDMHGESRTQGVAIPCAMKPADWRARTEGVCYFHGFEFTTKSGSAWVSENGLVTLYVHSNSNYTLRVLDKAPSPEIVQAAAKRGAAAFAEGLRSVPATDPGFAPILKAADAQGVTLQALDAWTHAWHAANLAQPVPGVSTLAHPDNDPAVNARRKESA